MQNKSLSQKKISGIAYEVQNYTKISDILTAVPIATHKDYSTATGTILIACKKLSDSLGYDLSNEQLETLTSDLIDKYKYESIEDIVYCLRKGRQGYYGTTYGKINMIVISEWMTKHLEEKAEERKRQHENRKAKDETNVDYNEYKQRTKSIKEVFQSKHIPKLIPTRGASPE